MAAVYRLPADALCAQDAELLRQNREDAAAVLAEQPLDAALWREPCGISILGDSISSWRLSFWHILREVLRGYPAVFHDFSVSGQKSGDLLAAMYPDIARAHAQLAHIMIGTNDCRRTLDVPNVLHTGLPEYEKNVRFRRTGSFTARTTASHSTRPCAALPPRRARSSTTWSLCTGRMRRRS